MNQILVKYSFVPFLILGLIPILPFHLKPIGLIVALLFGLVSLFLTKRVLLSYLFFNNILLFLLYAISYLYSDDKLYSLKYLETSLPLVLFPLFFLFISKFDFNKNNWQKIEFIFYNTYVISSVIYAILIFVYIFHLGYFSHKVTYDLSMSWISAYFWGFQNHPIYISIFLGVAILILIKLVLESTKNRFWYVLVGIIILFALLFLSRKAVVFALIPTSFFLFFKLNKNKKIRNVFIIINILSVLVLVFVFPNSFNRFKKIGNIELNQPIDMKNSTSIRIGIYNCVFTQVKDAGFFGYGIGDVKDKLNDCYKIRAKPLVGQHLNTHSTYLNIWLSLGFVGLLLFIFFLARLLMLAIVNKNFLFFSLLLFYLIVFLFENVLDRQNGVLLFAFLINFYTFKHIIVLKRNNEK